MFPSYIQKKQDWDSVKNPLANNIMDGMCVEIVVGQLRLCNQIQPNLSLAQIHLSAYYSYAR